MREDERGGGAHPMNLVKAAGILAIGIVVAVAVHSYLSPYQSCVHDVETATHPHTPPSFARSTLGGAEQR